VCFSWQRKRNWKLSGRKEKKPTCTTLAAATIEFSEMFSIFVSLQLESVVIMHENFNNKKKPVHSLIGRRCKTARSLPDFHNIFRVSHLWPERAALLKGWLWRVFLGGPCIRPTSERIKKSLQIKENRELVGNERLPNYFTLVRIKHKSDVVVTCRWLAIKKVEPIKSRFAIILIFWQSFH
jgi:hypothetical protein